MRGVRQWDVTDVPKLTAAEIVSAISTNPYDGKLRGMFWVPQCRVGCGFGQDGERTIDLWGITTNRPYWHTAIEVKVSRGDFSRDIRSPLKQRRARMMANEFYFAAPHGLLTASDLPIWAGLIEVRVTQEPVFNQAFVSIPAPVFDSSPPTWSFVASLVRRFSGEAAKAGGE